MAPSHLNRFCRVPIIARAVSMTPVVSTLLLLAGVFFSGLPAAGQASPPREAIVKQVANDIYFFFYHYMFNSLFKALNATFVAHEETNRIMEQVHPKEMARRVDGFKSRGYDPDEVKLIAPDVTFDSKMTIRLGGHEILLFYLGPGQQAGDTFVHFPHARLLFTPGAFAKHSMPNMAFTPSVENWIAMLDRIAVMDVDTILPAHGDSARRADVEELAAMLADEYATVKDAVSRGVGLDQALKTLTFPQYKDWRNYG